MPLYSFTKVDMVCLRLCFLGVSGVFFPLERMRRNSLSRSYFTSRIFRSPFRSFIIFLYAFISLAIKADTFCTLTMLHPENDMTLLATTLWDNFRVLVMYMYSSTITLFFISPTVGRGSSCSVVWSMPAAAEYGPIPAQNKITKERGRNRENVNLIPQINCSTKRQEFILLGH